MSDLNSMPRFKGIKLSSQSYCSGTHLYIETENFPYEVIGKLTSILQGPKTDKEVISRLARNLADGQLFYGKAINCRKDWPELMMEWMIAPIRNEKDEITYYLAIQRDVS